MLVQIENLLEYNGEGVERDTEELQEEEVLERGDYLQDDGEEEEEEMEQEVIIMI